MMLNMRAAHPLAPVSFLRSITPKWMLPGIVVTVLALCSLPAASQTPAGPKAKSRLASAIARTLDQGHAAILPPHVSHLLGISPDEHEVPVKQIAEMGDPVRGFEVSTAEHNNVVIFIESRTKKESTFYLTSRPGVLRKVLSVIDGVGYARVPTKKDRQAFEQEKQHWLDRLAPKHP